MIQEGFAEDSRAVARWFHLRNIDGQIMTIVANNFVHFRGHYIDRKMRLCDGDNCRFCAADVGNQRRYVFDVVLLPGGNQALYETSESVALQIRDIINVNSYGERIFFKVSRMSASKHSNCKVERISYKTNIELNTYMKQDIARVLHEQESFFRSDRKCQKDKQVLEPENWRNYKK